MYCVPRNKYVCNFWTTLNIGTKYKIVKAKISLNNSEEYHSPSFTGKERAIPYLDLGNYVKNPI